MNISPLSFRNVKRGIYKLLGSLCQLHQMLLLHVIEKKMFSNILHLPLFISVPCRMSLAACKLIYNAVFSWEWGRTAETQVEAERLKVGSWFWVRRGGTSWEHIFSGANLIGTIFIPSFLDLREEGLRLLLALGLLWQPQIRTLFEWRNETRYGGALNIAVKIAIRFNCSPSCLHVTMIQWNLLVLKIFPFTNLMFL